MAPVGCTALSDRLNLSPETVARIIARQFPNFARLPVRAMDRPGWDNLTYRLGDAFVVRMPSAPGYVAQVEKEQTWLPRLAPYLSRPIPQPVAHGKPDQDYPFPFAILNWIEGTPGTWQWPAAIDPLAHDLAAFLTSLQACSTESAPLAGEHNYFRGGDLSVYDAETRRAVETLGDRVDGPLCLSIWDNAIATAWPNAPVWLHGDIAPGNLLLEGDRLTAVIDFGCCGVGDPACDYALAFTHFDANARDTFQRQLNIDTGTLLRAQAWALWKALITLRDEPNDPGKRAMVERIAIAP